MGIRMKIIVAMVLMALLPSIIVGLSISFFIENSMSKDHLVQMRSIADLVKMNFQYFYNEKYLDITKASKAMPYIELLKSDESGSVSAVDGQKYDAAKEYMDTSIRNNQTEYMLINKAGRVILSNNPAHKDQMMNNTGFFNDIINGEDHYTSIMMEGQGISKLKMAVPVKDLKNNLIGILVEDIDISKFGDYISKVPVFNGDIYIIQRTGLIYLHIGDEKESPLLKILKDSSKFEQVLAELDDAEPDGNHDTITIDVDGKEVLGVYKTIEELDCIIFSTTNKDHIYEYTRLAEQIMLILILAMGVIAAVIGLIFGRTLVDQILDINKKIKEIAYGNLSARCKYSGDDEFRELCNHINLIAENYQMSEKSLRMLSRIDPLTYLPNRFAIDEILDTLLYKGKNQAILMMDVDGLKLINDKWGHDAGDKTLVEVAEILKSLPQNICYPSRYGEDEFLIFITDGSEEKYPEEVARYIIKKLMEIHFVGNARVNISVSIGIEYLTKERLDRAKLVKRSDMALYKAKEMGKNTYVVYSKNS